MTSETLKSFLLDLSVDIKSAITDEQKLSVMTKYDMTICGKDFNTINTIELRACILAKLNIDISINELNSLVEIVCPSLNMKLLPMRDANAQSYSEVDCYQIEFP